MALTTHHHLASRLKKEQRYTSFLVRATCSAHLILGLIILTIFGEDANYAVSRYVLSNKPLSNSTRRNPGGFPAIITSLAVGMATMKIKKIREYVRSEVFRGRLRRLLSLGSYAVLLGKEIPRYTA